MQLVTLLGTASAVTVPPCPQLPALVLRTTDMQDQLLTCKGPAALRKLRSTAELQNTLLALASETRDDDNVGPAGRTGGREQQSDKSIFKLNPDRTNWYKCMREQARVRAAEAADWVRRQQFKLLFIEPEGVLKKQCCIHVVPCAAAAVAKRRRSVFGARRYDAFRQH